MQEPEPEHSGEPETAREAAKDFIKPYVLDGWTLEEISKKRPTTDRNEYAARIGGGKMRDYRNQEHTVTPQEIAVTRIGTGPCWGLFDLAHIMAEIRDEARGYHQQSLAAIFEEQERIAQVQIEEAEQERQRAPRKRPAVFRSYNGGYCQNSACGAELGYIEADGGRDRQYCNDKCRVAAHRARQREQKRAATLQYYGELRDYWHMKGIRGEVLLRLQEILLQHGKAAARAATDAVLVALAASEQTGNDEQQRLIEEIMLEGESINFEEIQFDDFRLSQGVANWSEFVSYAATSQLRRLRGYLYERQQHAHYQAQARKRLEALSSDLQQ